MICLHKILPFFLSPLGIFLNLLILLISSNPYVSNYLTKKLEYPYKPIPISLIKKNDAVVVLGGMIHQVGDDNYSNL